LYRDAPLNSIWEGSGNVTALDLLRSLVRSPGGPDALRAELSLAAGADSRLDEATRRLGPLRAAFCASRMADPMGLAGPGASFGMLPQGLDLAVVLDRTRPVFPV